MAPINTHISNRRRPSSEGVRRSSLTQTTHIIKKQRIQAAQADRASTRYLLTFGRTKCWWYYYLLRVLATATLRQRNCRKTSHNLLCQAKGNLRS